MLTEPQLIKLIYKIFMTSSNGDNFFYTSVIWDFTSWAFFSRKNYMPYKKEKKNHVYYGVFETFEPIIFF